MTHQFSYIETERAHTKAEREANAVRRRERHERHRNAGNRWKTNTRASRRSFSSRPSTNGSAGTYDDIEALEEVNPVMMSWVAPDRRGVPSGGLQRSQAGERGVTPKGALRTNRREPWG